MSICHTNGKQALIQFETANIRIYRYFPKIRIKQAKQLPIPVASLAEQQLIVALIERIRTSKKMTPNKSIEKLEREIDKIVYQLYELTDAEIKIIEQSI